MALAAKAEANTERIGRPGDPCVMVIFGASGDLTRRKLIPALYNLGKNQLLSREFAVVGVAHDAMSSEEFRAKLKQDLLGMLSMLGRRLRFVRNFAVEGHWTTGDGNPACDRMFEIE